MRRPGYHFDPCRGRVPGSTRLLFETVATAHGSNDFIFRTVATAHGSNDFIFEMGATEVGNLSFQNAIGKSFRRTVHTFVAFDIRKNSHGYEWTIPHCLWPKSNPCTNCEPKPNCASFMERLPTIAIKLIETIVPNGANKPMKVLGDNEVWYIAKLSGAERMGPAAFFRELCVSKLASALGLLTPPPVEMLIEPELVSTCKGKDHWSLVKASVGSNYGSVFVNRCFEAQPVLLKARQKLLHPLSELYAFDAMADNADRNDRKPNCLLDESDNLWLIDHELAFAFIHHLFGPPPNPLKPPLNDLKNHLAFSFLANKTFDFEPFCAKLESLPKNFWDLVYTITPDAWKNTETDLQLIKIKAHFDVLVKGHRNLAHYLTTSLQ